MARYRYIAKTLSRQARKTCDDPDQQRFQVYRNLSHRAERDHHDLPEKTEEQDKPHGPHFCQDGQIVTTSGLRYRYRYAHVSHFLLARTHRACGVVQSHSEDWVLRVAVECGLEHVEARIQGFQPRPKVN